MPHKIAVLSGSALKIGKATADAGGIKQSSLRILWPDVVSFKRIGQTTQKRVIRGAVGGLIGAAAGSLVGPVGTAAGFAVGVGSQGFKTEVQACVLLKDGSEAVFQASVAVANELESWWVAHRT